MPCHSRRDKEPSSLSASDLDKQEEEEEESEVGSYRADLACEKGSAPIIQRPVDPVTSFEILDAFFSRQIGC